MLFDVFFDVMIVTQMICYIKSRMLRGECLSEKDEKMKWMGMIS